jgi:hypothetical protein
MRPKVLLGEFTGRRVMQLALVGWGRMWISRTPTPYGQEEPWGIDNGAFRMWRAGEPYDWTAFERRLLEAAELHRTHGLQPLLVVTPDHVAEGYKSLWASMAWLERWNEQERGRYWTRTFPWYLAVQDGMEPDELARLTCHCCESEEPILAHFDGLFLGGTPAWKARTARAWRALATSWDLQLHYARAGTPRKLRQAHDVGADSVDSAFPMWSDERWRAFEEVWAELGSQGEMFVQA